MSLWRRKAIEYVPSLKNLIEGKMVWNQMSLWIELNLEFEKAYENKRTEETDRTINEIWSFARYCSSFLRDEDMIQAVYCAFYEHLLDHSKIAEDLPNRINKKEYLDMEEVLTYHSSSERLEEVKAMFPK